MPVRGGIPAPRSMADSSALPQQEDSLRKALPAVDTTALKADITSIASRFLVDIAADPSDQSLHDSLDSLLNLQNLVESGRLGCQDYHDVRGRIDSLVETGFYLPLSTQPHAGGNDLLVLANPADASTSAFDHLEQAPVSSATSSTCLYNCKICAQQYREKRLQQDKWAAYDVCLTDEDANNDISAKISHARASFRHVTERLESSGNTIMKRWTEMSVSKRAAMLKVALPYVQNRPWAAASLLYKQANGNGYTWKCRHTEWLLPYLDLQSLSDTPWRLLALLHHRTQHSIEEWFMLDTQQLRVPFAQGTLRLAYNPHCVVTHGDRFGQLQQWDEAAAHRFDIVGFPRAQVTFEAQAQLGESMKTIVDLLLKIEAPTGNNKWLSSVKNAFGRPASAKALSGILDWPFSAPPVFDSHALLESLRLRRDTAKTQLRGVQDDPDLAQRLLEQATELANKIDQRPSMHQDLRLQLMMDHLDRYTCYQRAVEDLENSMSAHEGINEDSASAQHHQESLQLLGHSLRALFDYMRNELRFLATRQPAFDSYLCYCPKDFLLPHTRQEDTMLYVEDPIFWAIDQLIKYHDDRPFDYELLIGCVSEVLSRVGKKKRGRLNDQLHTHLEDMVVVIEAMSSLKSHRPSVSGKLGVNHSFQSTTAREQHKRWCARASARVLLLEDLTQLYEPLDKLLKMPRTWTKSGSISGNGHTESQGTLDLFWSEVRHAKDVLLKQNGASKQDRVTYLEHIVRPRARDPDNEVPDIEPMTLEPHNDTIEQADRASVADSLHEDRLLSTWPGSQRTPSALTGNSATSDKVPLSIQTVWGRLGTDEKVDFATPKPREKVKTRPITAPDEAPAPPPPEPVLPPPPELERVSVNSTSLELFQRMFTPQETHKRTACIDWEDLTAALVDAGCTMDSRGGSAVRFIRGGNGPNSSTVSVHKPHPDSSVNPIMLKDVAKRLERYFGWTKEVFEERVKVAGP
ncbi:hypothetical protein LTR53_009521 [Teratosphaeriaceae sp. CCFEE 6253]|nr:hypothetical protein LTR53_009521 [Teratosphaeriaceae sp. CCFEE 6253]